MPKEVTLTLRLPEELRDAFENYCQSVDQNKSQVVRALIRDLLLKKRQPNLPLG